MTLRNLQMSASVISKVGVPQLTDITDQLSKNPNYTWAQLAGVRDINDLTTIGIHHDAWPKKNTAKLTDLQLAEQIAEDHIALKMNEPLGDAGFPYHIWIRNGRAYQCNDLLDRTYGIASNNGYIVHICVSGDYVRYDQLTDADRNALYGAILAVQSVLPNYQQIKAHCELNPTDCPGYDYRKVKIDVAALALQVKSETDPAKVKEKCFVATNQHNYLYTEYAKDPVKNQWLEQWLLGIEKYMRDQGMFFDK